MKRLSTAIILLLLIAAPVRAATLTWNAGVDSDWDTSTANWTGDIWDNGVPDDAVLDGSGSGTITLTESITAGTVDISAGAYAIASDTLTVNTLITNSSSSACTISSIIAGDGSLYHTGSGVLTLAGNNTFTGGVYSSGTLGIYNNNALGTGPVEVNGGVLKVNDNLSIYNTVTLTNSSNLKVGVNGKTWTQYGDLHLNGTGLYILNDNSANRNAAIRGNLYGFGEVSVGRNYFRIYPSCTNHYSGTFRLYRRGAGDTILAIGEGFNLTNDIAIANSSNGNFRRLELINGSTNGTFSGNISITGSYKADADDGFQIRADAGETITVSGEISADPNDEGIDITGGGTVLLTGISTYNDPTTVRNATLGGNGTIAGTATFTNSASHSPGVDNVGVQTFSNLNYETGSTVIWQLGANSADSRGTDYAAIDVNGDLDFDATTTLELVFTNGSSTVDWSDSFWSIGHTWLLWHVAGTTTDFNDLTLTTNNWKDAQSDLFDTVRSNHFFSIIQSGNDVYIKYAPPPSGSIFYIW